VRFKSLIEHSPIPIVIVPSVVEITLDCSYTKADFGYSDREFVFLFAFDFFSILERKNPIAVVDAFTQAFPPNLLPDVRLVLKCINGDRNLEDFDRLKNAITDSRIKIMDEYLSKDRKNGLLSICDCYISLHRSEGFGLAIAEAMYLEKPVIATGWSGNMDFMTVNNSFPVDYDLTELTEDYGPYKQGQVWAEPNVDHAASIMRFVFENPIDARKKAIRAASDMRLHNSSQAIASIIQNRFPFINRAILESATTARLINDLQSNKLQIQAQLQVIQVELAHAQILQQSTQEELGRSQSELQDIQVKLVHSQSELQNTQVKLVHSQSELQNTQVGLERLRSQFQLIQSELGNTQAQLQCTRAELGQSQAQFEATQTELNIQNILQVKYLTEIEAMKTSKFWKLRKIWFQLKYKLGLEREE
jgi:hypothetical protein